MKIDPVPSRSLVPMSYQEAMRYWYGHVNYEQQAPQPADLKLDHMRSLLARLGNPQERLRIVHVAGSKGKGSTSAMMAAILREAGYRTGLFTSPHLSRVEERIQADGHAISAVELADLMTQIAMAIEESQRQSQVSPTFFEIASALGFLHFVRKQVDIAVVEVGLGGRFDSTNVCLPEVAVITSISLDHTKQLGDRLSSIAGEKAGIIKTGRPVVSGVMTPEARDVIESVARERGATLLQLGNDFSYDCKAGFPALSRKPRIRFTMGDQSWPEMDLGLLGDHQAANASVVLATIEQLRKAGWRVPQRAVSRGLADVYWPARLEVMSRAPWIVLDCAHNVASALALARTLEESFPAKRRILIFASSKDKDVAGMFRVLGPSFQHAHVTQYANNPRSYAPSKLGELWRANANTECTVHASAAMALPAALAQANPESLVCITGSVFLAGELRPTLLEHFNGLSL
jgi:dihydrofolate synthase/folylpolyglutamate synthase